MNIYEIHATVVGLQAIEYPSIRSKHVLFYRLLHTQKRSFDDFDIQNYSSFYKYSSHSSSNQYLLNPIQSMFQNFEKLNPLFAFTSLLIRSFSIIDFSMISF